MGHVWTCQHGKIQSGSPKINDQGTSKQHSLPNHEHPRSEQKGRFNQAKLDCAIFVHDQASPILQSGLVMVLLFLAVASPGDRTPKYTRSRDRLSDQKEQACP